MCGAPLHALDRDLKTGMFKRTKDDREDKLLLSDLSSYSKKKSGGGKGKDRQKVAVMSGHSTPKKRSSAPSAGYCEQGQI